MTRQVSDSVAVAAARLACDWAQQGADSAPTVKPGPEHGLSDGVQLLVWEEGPEDWVYNFPQSIEATTFRHTAGVWFEPVNLSVLAIIAED
jgi:hypothetical protein